MPELKSEVHHWWPECLSEFWAGADGCVTRLTPQGKERRAPPKNFGGIGNGHHVKLGRGRPSPWDHTFEPQFQRADDSFPAMIRWLEGLHRAPVPTTKTTTRERFLPQPITDDQFTLLVECLVSLNVRSPNFRQAACAAAVHFGPTKSKSELETIAAFNMRHCQRMIADSIGKRGRFAVLYSTDREFIFGDGFFTSIMGTSVAPTAPRMLIPLTPNMSVLYASPHWYSTEPRLVTMTLMADEVDFNNDTVQVYAKNEVFYRNDKPRVIDAFKQNQHLHYSDSRNSVELGLIQQLPGVRPLGTGMPFGGF